MGDGSQRGEGCGGGELLAQCLGQIAHLGKVFCIPLVDPFPNLAGTKRWNLELGQPLAQLRKVKIQQSDPFGVGALFWEGLYSFWGCQGRSWPFLSKYRMLLAVYT